MLRGPSPGYGLNRRTRAGIFTIAIIHLQHKQYQSLQVMFQDLYALLITVKIVLKRRFAVAELFWLKKTLRYAWRGA